ncbi:MAG: glycerol kinase GlpK [Cucumibacter sp.]
MRKFLLAIDQGTTSTRAILFTPDLDPVASGQREITQIFPQSGWVEHDPREIWTSVTATVAEALQKAGAAANDIAGIGITNQRETIVVWDRNSGEPVHNAIVWQDRRTADFCRALREAGEAAAVTARTGLLLDPYFSGTKLNWLLENVDGVRSLADTGDLMAGTIDSWLIHRLTGGKRHLTDATNASRTLLYNIHDGRWDPGLLDLFSIPAHTLPDVFDCAADYGTTDKPIFGAEIPIAGVAGDQHAAAIGQACFSPGMVKSTYGTGCFAMLNTGATAVPSNNRLLTTLCYQLAGKPTYALEGSIFVAGAAVQWLRDGLGVIAKAEDTAAMAEAADPTQNVILVPAFVGLGAPYWDAEARGALFGLTRNTGPNDLARAALESVGYQTRDLMNAMHADFASPADTVLRVDGGMARSDWSMQFLADILQAPVDRPAGIETTALGAAYLAGLQLGLCPPPDAMAKSWALDRRFTPMQSPQWARHKYGLWQDAVRRTLSH